MNITTIECTSDNPFRCARKCAKTVALGLLLLLGTRTGVAATIDFLVDDQGSKTTQTAYVTASHVIIKAVGDGRVQDVVFDTRTRTLFLIDHRKRNYLEINETTIDEVASMMESVSRTVAGSSESVTALLGSLGITGTTDLETTDTGSNLKVGGYPCRLFRSTAAEQLVAELCVAAAAPLRFSAQDLRTIQSFVSFGSELASRAGDLLAVLGVTLPPLDVVGEGVPIALYTRKNNSEFRLQRIDHGVREAPSAAIPAGYNRVSVPLTSS